MTTDITNIGPYLIGSILGTGGMGTVYRAIDERSGLTVAFKVLLRKELRTTEGLLAARRLRDEARAAATVEHAGIVRCVDGGDDEELGPYVVYEFVPGGTLRDRLDDHGPLPVDTAIRSLAIPLLDGLAALHDNGIVHRDIKPENIFCRDTGAYALGDLGLALFEGRQAKTATGVIVGTPGYMSPEALVGAKVGPLGDLYSAAVVIVEALTSYLPFGDIDRENCLVAQLTKEPTPVDLVGFGVPPPLASPLAECLFRDPDERFGSCHELAEALARAETATPAHRTILESEERNKEIATAAPEGAHSVLSPDRVARKHGGARKHAVAGKNGVVDKKRTIATTERIRLLWRRKTFRAWAAFFALALLMILVSRATWFDDEAASPVGASLIAQAENSHQFSAVELAQFLEEVSRQSSVLPAYQWNTLYEELASKVAPASLVTSAMDAVIAEQQERQHRAAADWRAAIETVWGKRDERRGIPLNLEAYIISRCVLAQGFDSSVRTELLDKSVRRLRNLPVSKLFSPDGRSHRWVLTLLNAYTVARHGTAEEYEDLCAALDSFRGPPGCSPDYTLVAQLVADGVSTQAQERGFSPPPESLSTMLKTDEELRAAAQQWEIKINGLTNVANTAAQRVGEQINKAVLQGLWRKSDIERLDRSYVRHLRKACWSSWALSGFLTTNPFISRQSFNILRVVHKYQYLEFSHPDYLARPSERPDWGIGFNHESVVNRALDGALLQFRLLERTGLDEPSRIRAEYCLLHSLNSVARTNIGHVQVFFDGIDELFTGTSHSTRMLKAYYSGHRQAWSGKAAEGTRYFSKAWHMLLERYGVANEGSEYYRQSSSSVIGELGALYLYISSNWLDCLKAARLEEQRSKAARDTFRELEWLADIEGIRQDHRWRDCRGWIAAHVIDVALGHARAERAGAADGAFGIDEEMIARARTVLKSIAELDWKTTANVNDELVAHARDLLKGRPLRTKNYVTIPLVQLNLPKVFRRKN